MTRPRTIAIGAFALLLAATPFLPHGGGDEGALLPSSKQRPAGLPVATTAALGPVTPDLRAEIDRVVAQGRSLGRISAARGVAPLAAALVRCADFQGQRYCLNSGWTTRTPEEVQSRTVHAARTLSRPSAATDSTGDLDLLSTLERTAALSPAARARAERAELTRAARSVAKVWLLRHQIEGVPLPSDFLIRHPEARVADASTSTSAPPRPPRRAAAPPSARARPAATTPGAARC